jgi:integrase
MTVKVREYVKSSHTGFEADIRFKWPDGSTFRRRYRAPVNTKAQAQRWGEDLERRIYAQGQDGTLARSKRDDAPSEAANTDTKEVPTLKEFWPKFIAGHCVANRQKPSGIERKESAYRTWLEPRMGDKRLDEIGATDIVALKAELAKRSAKTANNVLTALSACLKFAGPDGLKRSEGLGIIKTVPKIRLLPIDTDETPEWYEVPDYRRLVEAAVKLDARGHLLVLLGGSAGLRRGEIMALKWTDLDIKRRIIHVQRSIWKGRKVAEVHETTTKGGKGRKVRMTSELAAALAKHRNLQERVLMTEDGGALTNKIVRRWFERVQRAAGLEVTGAIHRLRHTFCSMLAAEGAPPGAIKELAGHASLSTTMKYMHLSPTTLDAAIGLLDRAFGETVEKGAAAGV